MINAADARIDAKAASLYLRTGMGESGTLTIASVPTDCSVLIDKDVQTVGDDGQIIGIVDTATFLLAEVTPVGGAILTVGTETWSLVSELSANGSTAQWVLE